MSSNTIPIPPPPTPPPQEEEVSGTLQELPPPPPYTTDPQQEETAAAPSQPMNNVPKILPVCEKPTFPPPAYTELPVVIIEPNGDLESPAEETREDGRTDSVVSPLLWLFAILAILLFSPCGYLAFAFTCFAFWSETGGNNQAARWLSSIARICAFISFVMGMLILVSTRFTPTANTEDSYCLFDGKSYELCF